MVMANGFNEMSQNEMMEVDGGIGWGVVVLIIAGAMALATTAEGCGHADAEEKAGK